MVILFGIRLRVFLPPLFVSSLASSVFIFVKFLGVFGRNQFTRSDRAKSSVERKRVHDDHVRAIENTPFYHR